MTVRTPSSRDVAWLALPLVIGAGVLASMAAGGLTGAEIATASAISGVYLFLVLAAVSTGAFARPVDIAKLMIARARDRGIQFLLRSAPMTTAVRLEAVETRGACPLGIRSGYRWNLKASGRMDAPLCVAAVVSVNSALGGSKAELPRTLACECPFGDNMVKFRSTAVA